MLMCTKNLCHTIKKLGYFKQYDTILNNEVLLNPHTQNEIFDRSISIVCLFFKTGISVREDIVLGGRKNFALKINSLP